MTSAASNFPAPPYPPWAESYNDRAERLHSLGRMQPSGLTSTEAVENPGAWDTMNDVEALIMFSLRH